MIESPFNDGIQPKQPEQSPSRNDPVGLCHLLVLGIQERLDEGVDVLFFDQDHAISRQGVFKTMLFYFLARIRANTKCIDEFKSLPSGLRP